jgi:transcriptional regulator with XRE-family HTH domain
MNCPHCGKPLPGPDLTAGPDIRAAREAAGLSREALARAAGISTSALYQIERGDKAPKVQTVGKIREALGRK